MRIQLSDHFTYRRLLTFVFPSVIMMVCTSVYSIVDGLFISNFVGKVPLAALNLIFPFLMALGSLGFMVGTGGSAIVSKTLGEGKRELANRYFSMMVYATIVFSLILTVFGFLGMPWIVSALGAEGELAKDALLYGRILITFQTAFMLQNVFQSFFVTAEKPGLSLRMSVAAGLTNFALDFLFIAVLHLGVAGAAAATVMGQMVGGIVPLFYFARKNDSLLQLTKTKMEWPVLLRTCTNGSSEMMTNLSSSFVGTLYNLQMMRFAGADGLAAYGVVMYVNFIFAAIFIGYAIGSGPVIGYHYGAGNWNELAGLLRKSLTIVLAAGIALTAAAELLASPLVKLFVGYDPELYAMTCHGFRIYAISFLFSGFNVFGSAFFTALGNGLVSAVISFLRTLVFEAASVMILPILLDLNGIWLAIGVAEFCALMVTMNFLRMGKKKYHYGAQDA